MPAKSRKETGRGKKTTTPGVGDFNPKVISAYRKMATSKDRLDDYYDSEPDVPHWTLDFDWDSAEYVLIDMAIGENGGEQLGPIKGKTLALCAARAWSQRNNYCCIEIKEVSHGCPVGCINYQGELELHEISDE